jgi:hypothetical protein
MIELKNSKIQYLGQVSGRDRYTLDAFIGAVQMREPGGQWQDIKPCLVRDADGWHIEGAPYYAEVKDDGARLFCPDRNETSRFIRLPAPALFDGLGRNIASNPARLDGAIVPNQITMPAEWGEIRIIFSNTGMHFEILFTQAPPPALFGKDSPRILLDVETSGVDMEQIIKSRQGIGISRPQLTAAGADVLLSQSPEHWLDWNYKDGQMELGLDFGELAFPVLLKNTTIDMQVGASGDDGNRQPGTGFNYGNYQMYAGYESGSYHMFMRFTGVTISGTVTTSYLQLYGFGSYAGSPHMKIRGVDEDSPAAPTTYTEFDADPLTDAGIDWDTAFSSIQWYNSPSINSIVQELVDSYTISNDAIMFQIRDDIGSGSNYNGTRTWDYDPTYAPKLHIEYTAGGPTVKTASETGSGVEGRLLRAAASRGETAGGTDTRQSLLASLIKSDSGSGVEQSLQTSSAAKLSAETGAGLETSYLVASLISGEAGHGVDTGAIPGQKSVIDEDTGLGYDALKALIGASGAVSDMKLPGRQGQVKIPSKGVNL